MTTLTPAQLTELLRQNARGSYATEAAVELLIAHDRWLRRGDFLAACVEYDQLADAPPVAWVDWHAVPTFLARADASSSCSSSEARMLTLAADLAGVDTRRSLDDLLTGLDDLNGRLVLDAIAHVLTRGGGR